MCPSGTRTRHNHNLYDQYTGLATPETTIAWAAMKRNLGTTFSVTWGIWQLMQRSSSYERRFDRRKRETTKSNMSMTYIRTFVDSQITRQRSTNWMINVQLVSSYERGFDRRKRETSKSNMSMNYIRTFMDSQITTQRSTLTSILWYTLIYVPCRHKRQSILNSPR